MNRLPFLLSRWKGVISLGVFLDESELPRLHSALNAFTTQHRVIFSFYVRKRITPSSIPVFFTANKKNIYFPSGIFPMNILRDMSIESIDTSHYVAVDVDVFFSFTLEDDIERNRKLLDDQNNILLIPLLEVIGSKEVYACRATDVCEHMCESIPL